MPSFHCSCLLLGCLFLFTACTDPEPPLTLEACQDRKPYFPLSGPALASSPYTGFEEVIFENVRGERQLYRVVNYPVTIDESSVSGADTPLFCWDRELLRTELVREGNERALIRWEVAGSPRSTNDLEEPGTELWVSSRFTSLEPIVFGLFDYEFGELDTLRGISITILGRTYDDIFTNTVNDDGSGPLTSAWSFDLGVVAFRDENDELWGLVARR